MRHVAAKHSIETEKV